MDTLAPETVSSVPPIPVPPKAAKKAAPAAPKKYKIIIEEGGMQDLPFVFVGVNQDTYKIMRGEEVTIPESVKEVLDHAMTTTLYQDRNGRRSPRRSPRFPYRLIGEVA